MTVASHEQVSNVNQLLNVLQFIVGETRHAAIHQRQLQEECIEDIVMTHATLLCVLTTIFQILQTINGSRWVSGSFEMNDQALDSLRPKGAKLLLLNNILLLPATEDPATAAEDTSKEVVVSSLFSFVKVPNVKTVNTLGLPCTKSHPS